LLVLGLLVIAVLIAVGSLFVSAQTITATSTTSNVGQLLKTLRQGARGDDVKVLQALLAADTSIYPDGLITGYFGSLTAKAVKKLQTKNNLEQVGNVGPKTLQKLNEMLTQNPMGLENTNEGKKPCAIVPPGHLIAPGWLKKQGGVKPTVPSCQTLPPGIAKKLGISATTTPDVLTPVISSVSASSTASTTAAIIWTTNEAATSKVYYATTSPLSFATTTLFVASSTLVTSHSLNLTGLTASMTYYFAVESKDAANNTATSSQQSFVTLQQ